MPRIRGRTARWAVADRAFEDAADDALLPPDLALAELAVGDQARELGAGAGAAGRAIVGLAGAEDEVLAVGTGRGGRAEQLDVVDLAAVGARDPLCGQGLTDSPGDVGQPFDVRQGEVLAVVADEEEPVATPGDIATYGPSPGTSTRTSGASR